MRRTHVIAMLIGVAVLVVCARTSASGSAQDPRERAKREAWGWAVLTVSILERGEGGQQPAIGEWLNDFRLVESSVPAFTEAARFPVLDSEALVSRNPRFWRACFAMAPGDPGWSLLHAALLLCGGEAERATTVAELGLQHGAVAPEFRRGLLAVIAAAEAAEAGSRSLVLQGVVLHDARDFDGALRRFDAALALWPANARAHYERGATLRLKAMGDAPRPVSSSAEPGEPPGDPPATREAFARARRHDPWCALAYQGDDPVAVERFMALVRVALPIWEAVRKRPEGATREELRDLSESCREAGADEFALVARQQLVARNRLYRTEDFELIAECAHRLAGVTGLEAILTRTAGDFRLVRHLPAPDAPSTMTDVATGGLPAAEAQLAAERERIIKSAKFREKEKTAKPKVKKRSKKRRNG